MGYLVWKCVGIRVLVAVIVAVVVVVVVMVSYECGATNAAVVPHRLSRPLILPPRPPTTLHLTTPTPRKLPINQDKIQ